MKNENCRIETRNWSNNDWSQITEVNDITFLTG